MSELLKTAPEYIWLQISDDPYDADLPFPDVAKTDITWCQDSVLACEVKYVRADIANQKRGEL